MPGNINDRKGFSNKGLGSSKKSVGVQGSGGPIGSKNVSLVNNPRGMSPKSLGGGRMPLAQGPVQEHPGRAKNSGRK